MPELFDITDWHQQPWFSTGGTRAKKYLQNPENHKYYYFKKSYKTQGRNYFFEFWSEIIATEIGNRLGFTVLKYDLAVDGNEMGCISESMIQNENEALIEGGRYLQAHDMRFDPNVKEGRKLYSFDLIEEALAFFDLDHINNIIEIIVFDSIIGNGDRHQENWAFINEHTAFSKSLDGIDKVAKKNVEIPKWIKWLFSGTYDFEKRQKKQNGNIIDLQLQKKKSFAPIFDNGSSLGRELEEEKVLRMLNDKQELDAYINRGVSEIHWDNDKITHFNFLKNLLQTSYREVVLEVIKRVINSYNSSNLEKIILSIDDKVPENLNKYKLPESRKSLILKLVSLRIERLRELSYAGI